MSDRETGGVPGVHEARVLDERGTVFVTAHSQAVTLKQNGDLIRVDPKAARELSIDLAQCLDGVTDDHMRNYSIQPGPLKCQGVGRVAVNRLEISVVFTRALTDDELRFFHDVIGRTCPLMDGVTP